MPASTNNKALFAPIPPLDPAKRARSIRDAIAKHKIKQTSIIEQTLAILDQIAQEQKKTA